MPADSSHGPRQVIPQPTGARDTRGRLRFPAMALAAVALLVGTWAGLLRAGWDLPGERQSFLVTHGPTMALGFLGTLIAVERAVALGRRWAYVAPLISGAASVWLLAGGRQEVGAAGLAVAGLMLVAGSALVVRIQPAIHTASMAAGAVAWPVAALLWLADRPVADLVPWLAGFLVLTIAGERLSLARLGRLTASGRAAFVAVLALLALGAALSAVQRDTGLRVCGVALVALAAWLARYDVARRTVLRGGEAQYVAACMLAGYAWMAVAGVLWLALGDAMAGARHDAMLHALFLGFVISMVFGHAPMIVEAVVGPRVEFGRQFYVHLLLLHASLAARLFGDAGIDELRRWGSMFNAVAILLFIAVTALAARRSPRAARGTRNPHSLPPP